MKSHHIALGRPQKVNDLRQAGVLQLHRLSVACVELSSLWNWNTKQRFYFLSQRPGISWSSFSFPFFFFFNPHPQILVTPVHMVWGQWLVSYRMTPEGLCHHRRMSPSSWLQWPSGRKKLTRFWIIHFGTGVVIQEVYCELFYFLSLGGSVLEDIEIFAMCKQK